MDPYDLARKVARKECTDSQVTAALDVPIDRNRGLRFASLNVNGCRSLVKRESVDSYLFSQGVHVAVLQEVNLHCEKVGTANFQWLLGAATTNRKRGLAILLRHGIGIRVMDHKYRGPNIQYIKAAYEVCSCGIHFYNIH